MIENNTTVILTLDRPRELKLTHRVMKRFCAEHKVRLNEIDKACEDYDVMIDLVVKMLMRDDPSLTVEACEDLLDEAPFGAVIHAFTKAIEAAFSVEEDEAGNPPEKARDSTGIEV